MDIQHEVQLVILRELLFRTSARFSDLNSTGLDNNHFNFHLKRLIEMELVEKSGEVYKLTSKGLEVAGRLDTEIMELIRQPKVGVSVFVTRQYEGKMQVLIGKRLKDPNKGLWGAFFAQKVRLGESVYETAARCLETEVGISATFRFMGSQRLIRKIDGEISQDVIFTCLAAENIQGEIKVKTVESENKWVDIDLAYDLPDSFEDMNRDLDIIKAKNVYFEERTVQE